MLLLNNSEYRFSDLIKCDQTLKLTQIVFLLLTGVVPCLEHTNSSFNKLHFLKCHDSVALETVTLAYKSLPKEI